MKGFDKPKLEVSDIFHQFGDLLGPLSKPQRKVVQAIKNCRTSVLGGHRQQCNRCEFETISYNSCRNRHCPKCQFLARSKWIDQRRADLLPCQYFHVVFTVPSELRALILVNQKLCYDALFRAASQTLKEVAATPEHLGAEIGAIGVLHTWGQNLLDHPHLHFIVPGGGLNQKKTQWIACKEDYFLPIKVLSSVFRGKFLGLLEQAFDGERLQFVGAVQPLRSPVIFKDLLITCASKEFIVYSKETFAGPEEVIHYLGQYTHRIAISNYRLVKLDGERVSFKVRDKANPAKKKIVCLHVKEFMRRFLLHVLPKGYVRIRHFGLLGSRTKKKKIAIVRRLNGIVTKIKESAQETWREILLRVTGIDIHRCPKCLLGTMTETGVLASALNSS